MRKARSVLAAVILALTLMPVGSDAATTSQTLTATSRQQAEDREHPRAHLLPIFVPQPYHRGARVCAYYENDAYHQLEQGRVKLDVSVWRDGERIARTRFKRRAVEANQLDLGCRAVPRLRRGDVVLFDFRFREMPRLSPRIFSHGGLVNTYMAVTATIEPPPAESAAGQR